MAKEILYIIFQPSWKKISNVLKNKLKGKTEENKVKYQGVA